MALTYRAKGSGEFKRIPAGSHIAVCDIVADVGLQETFFGTKRQVYIRFEVPEERWKYEKDGEQKEGPGVIGNFYTASMNKKARMRKTLEGWRSRQFTDAEAEAFDISSVLGKSCMITVQDSQPDADGRVYSNISGIGPIPKGMKAPTAELPLLLYHDGDKSMYLRLPEWIRKKIDEQVPEPDAEEPSIDYSQHTAFEATDEDLPPF